MSHNDELLQQKKEGWDHFVFAAKYGTIAAFLVAMGIMFILA
ncbi:hypothetical protein [Kiloniella sp. b19]